MVRRIILENVGASERFDAAFQTGLNIIKTKNTDEVAYSLGYITNNVPLCKSFPVRLCENSKIFAEISLDGEYVFDSSAKSDKEKISSLFSKSREEDEICFYANGKFKNYISRLAYYKDHEFFYPNGRLARLTNGICLVRSFRAYLTEYIRKFKPQRLNPNKDYFINISETGEFFVYRENRKKVFLSAIEETLFDFFCFLNIIEFWEGFEAIKDLNFIKKPIIITDLFERIDESIPKKHIINRLKKLDRQIFLIENE